MFDNCVFSPFDIPSISENIFDFPDALQNAQQDSPRKSSKVKSTTTTVTHSAATEVIDVFTPEVTFDENFVHLLSDDISLQTSLEFSPMFANATAFAQQQCTQQAEAPVSALQQVVECLETQEPGYITPNVKKKRTKVKAESPPQSRSCTPNSAESQYLALYNTQEEADAEHQNREWVTVYVDPAIIKDGDVSITSKTRCDAPTSATPDRLYSSLKYEIRQVARGSFTSAFPFLLSRITAVDGATNEELKKNGEKIVKGLIEAALVTPQQPKADKTTLEGSLKVQFTECSQNLDKRDFAWQVSYFQPNDLNTPVLIKRSASFKVFARKPNVKKEKADDTKVEKSIAVTKRRRDSVAEAMPAPKTRKLEVQIPKQQQQYQQPITLPASFLQMPFAVAPVPQTQQPFRQAQQQQSSHFSEFCKRLDDLVACNARLAADERKTALSLVAHKLLAVAGSPSVTDSQSAAMSSPRSAELYAKLRQLC